MYLVFFFVVYNVIFVLLSVTIVLCILAPTFDVTVVPETPLLLHQEKVLRVLSNERLMSHGALNRVGKLHYLNNQKGGNTFGRTKRVFCKNPIGVSFHILSSIFVCTFSPKRNQGFAAPSPPRLTVQSRRCVQPPNPLNAKAQTFLSYNFF